MSVTRSLRFGAIAACLSMMCMAQPTWAGSRASSVSSPAGESWAAEHPRQEEVIQRVEKQENRVDQLGAENKLTPGQETKLLSKDTKILNQDRSMASVNGGYITKTQKKALNQELNTVNKAIKTDSGN